MNVISVAVYRYDINLLGEDTKVLKMNTITLLDAFKKVRPEVKTEKTW
jgi:hypothetical protein